MAIEFLRHTAEKLNKKIHSGNKKVGTDYDPRIEELLTLAIDASEISDMQESRRLYSEVASEAVAIYYNIETAEITPDDNIYRAAHAEIAVTSFLSAGKKRDALEFGSFVVTDPLVPEGTKLKILKAIEIFA